MMVYVIVEASDMQTLADEVQQAIEHGFKPLGGVAVSDGTYVQAMTKE